jgi:MoxR-like ATPase
MLAVENSLSVLDKLNVLRRELNRKFLEREEIIDLVLTGIISRRHGFLGGPPGTGKTDLLKTVASAFSGKFYRRLMSADLMPNDLLGSPDFTALKEGRVVRRLEEGIASAAIAFLDEMFKGNGRTLNALLELMEEGTISEGGSVYRSALQSMWGASNELPKDGNLKPFWDRLSLRAWVNYVSEPSRKILMERSAGLVPTPTVSTVMTESELAQLQSMAVDIDFPESMVEKLRFFLTHLANEHGLMVSDRVAMSFAPILKAYALVTGRDQVDEDCFAILSYTTWCEQSDREAIQQTLLKMQQMARQQADAIVSQFTSLIQGLSAYDATQDRIQWMSQITSAKAQMIQLYESARSDINGEHPEQFDRVERKYQRNIKSIEKWLREAYS